MPETIIDQGVSERRQLRDDPLGAPLAGPPPDLATNLQPAALLDPTPGGHHVWCAELERLDPSVGLDRHRWPFAIFDRVGSSAETHASRRSRRPGRARGAATPTASRRRSVGSSRPTARIVTLVSVNPSAVCTDRAEPAVPGGASSDTADGELGRVGDDRDTPDERHHDDDRGPARRKAGRRRSPTSPTSPSRRWSLSSGRRGRRRRPRRPSRRRLLPRRRTPSARRSRGRTCRPRRSSPRRKIGIHVHIANSSHMWPK